MKVLVTGADGLLGSNLVRELIDRGHEVSVFLLPNSQAKSLDGLPIKRFFGNILEIDTLLPALAKQEALIHAAANTNIWPSRSEIVRKVNIEGTQNVIEATLRQQIKRMIYIGTANSFGFGSKSRPGTEIQPYASSRYGLDYMDSKYEAQQLILDAVRDRQLPALIVNPTFMLGPYDSKPSAGAMILAIYHRKVPGFAPGGRNYIYVKDVATAIANGLEKGRIGECYIAGNTNLSYREMFTRIAKIVKVKPPKVGFPAFILHLYGGIGSLVGKLTRRAPTVSYPMALISCDEHYFNAQKAVEELDMPQTSIDQAIQESFEWLNDNGYV